VQVIDGVLRVIVADLRGKFKIDAKESAFQFGNEFLVGIACIADIALKARRVLLSGQLPACVCEKCFS